MLHQHTSSTYHPESLEEGGCGICLGAGGGSDRRLLPPEGHQCEQQGQPRWDGEAPQLEVEGGGGGGGGGTRVLLTNMILLEFLFLDSNLRKCNLPGGACP